MRRRGRREVRGRVSRGVAVRDVAQQCDVADAAAGEVDQDRVSRGVVADPPDQLNRAIAAGCREGDLRRGPGRAHGT